MNLKSIAKCLPLASAILAGLTMAFSTTGAVAQDTFPSRPIKIIVPFSPGASDAQIRILAPLIGAKLGQPVIVENVPGASGIVAAQQVQRSRPDGYTLYFTGSAGLTLVPAYRPELPYRLADFVPIANVSTLPGVMVIRNSLPFKSARELINSAKANPGKLNFGSAGVGTASHTFGVGPQVFGGFTMTHIPYKGMSDAIQAIIGGQLDVGFAIPNLVIAHIRSGTLRPLAVTTATRNEYFPDVPTFKEIGVDYVDSENYGLVGPKGLPTAIVDRVSAAVAEAMNSPEFIDVMKKTLTSTLYMNPAQYRTFLLEREKMWTTNLANPNFAAHLKQ